MRNFWQRKPQLILAEECPCTFPVALIDQVTPELLELVSHEGFEIRATVAKANASGTIFSISQDTISRPNLELMIEAVLDRATGEMVQDYVEYADEFPEGYCMTCGKSLVSDKVDLAIDHIALNVWTESSPNFFEGAPEQCFCSWTHLLDYLVCMPDSAHLWMSMQYIFPGSLRTDQVTPAYVERARQAAAEQHQDLADIADKKV